MHFYTSDLRGGEVCDGSSLNTTHVLVPVRPAGDSPTQADLEAGWASLPLQQAGQTERNASGETGKLD